MYISRVASGQIELLDGMHHQVGSWATLTSAQPQLYWISKPGDPSTTFLSMATNNRFYYFLGRNVRQTFLSSRTYA